MSFRSMQDANAAGTVDLGPIDIKRYEEVSMDPFSDQRDFSIVIFSFHKNNEFIATKPRDDIRGPQTFPEPCGNSDEKLIPRHVAKTIVHQFEMIEIDK